MKHFQVSKYSKDQDDEWTSITDIGRFFNGVVLTPEEYLRIENIYIEAIRVFIKHNSKSYKVKFLMDLRGGDEADEWLFAIENPLITVRGGEYIDELPILPLCRLCLRDLMGIRLEADNGDYITFTYDFYCRLGISGDVGLCLPDLSRLGLTVNEMENAPNE
jgi:hypothetical protein